MGIIAPLPTRHPGVDGAAFRRSITPYYSKFEFGWRSDDNRGWYGGCGDDSPADFPTNASTNTSSSSSEYDRHEHQ